MPRHFSEDEKNNIRDKLLLEGKKLFESQGLVKTSVDQMVEAVGIAKGSFYNFYPSKESMAFDLLMSLEQTLHQEEVIYLEQMLHSQDFPQAMSLMIMYSLQQMENNPFLFVMGNADLIQRIWHKLSDEEKERRAAQDREKVNDFIDIARQNGYTLTTSIDIFQASLNCFFFAFLNLPMIGEAGEDALQSIINASLNELFRRDAVERKSA